MSEESGFISPNSTDAIARSQPCLCIAERELQQDIPEKLKDIA